MKNIKFLVVFLLTIISNNGYGQSSCDNLFESLRIGNDFIVSGKTTTGLPVFTKLDSNGNELWRVVDVTNGNYLRFIDLDLFSDGFIYAKLNLPVQYYTGDMFRIIKINPVNGQVLWRTTIYESDSDAEAGLLDYDPTNIYFYNPTNNNNGGNIAGFKTYLINRITGATQLSFDVVQSSRFFSMTMDSKKNIIYGLTVNNVPVITKANGLNINNVIWRKSYLILNGGATLHSIDKFIIDKSDNLYAIGFNDGVGTIFESNRVDIFKIETNFGNSIWSLNDITSEKIITDYKLLNDALYLSFQHIYIGSVYTAFEIVKIDVINGIKLWNSSLNKMTPLPGFDDDNQAIATFDLDCNGSLYATGYFGSDNYGPQNWGIMKMNTTTGAKVSELKITANPNTDNTLSYGNGTYVLGNNVVFLGELQYSLTNTLRTFVKTNLLLGVNYEKKYYCFIDSDGDSIQDYNENVNGNGFINNDDTDNDGIANYLDNDDDNDGILTINEDANNNNNPLDDFNDISQPNLPDYLNPNITLSLNEISNTNNFISIFPNPASNVINIKYTSNIEVIKVELFSINGQKINEYNHKPQILNIEHLQSGVYFIRVYSDLGLLNYKVIKL